MAASILTSLMLWSTWLLPGVSLDRIGSDVSSPALSCSALASPLELTIQAWPLAELPSWTLSEANSEEEESSDNDDNVIVAERVWTLPRSGPLDLSSTIRLDRGFACSPIRSTILRC